MRKFLDGRKKHIKCKIINLQVQSKPIEAFLLLVVFQISACKANKFIHKNVEEFIKQLTMMPLRGKEMKMQSKQI